MNAKDFLQYWLKAAADDFDTAEKLIQVKKYHHGLFFCHLALEKLLKGLVYKNTQNHADPIHDLKKLALQASLDIVKIQEKELDEITTWNIRARYDSYKFEFYKKANKEFTHRWFSKAKDIYLWLKNQF
ncbi:hypothetical protein A2960_06130 [Candidatus Gottesmanbacteria bacterium RIFCSPLOWO2_01_FULL_39_12b]|uniref:HEPN domain-containing protein n=1 Tax=Candidatus Gottesmanbacteria bacterium RIFCSPLOWO2_01_FULL_39_12b TaxID=1798388 RepID=A0A1F6AQ71_9BACT|nr:MAG: hypothetical protein A2960_06130 [Candidatus Gottesmanbacteria bacterium RIFCSPLOWO2_01_FULL_39_12b]